MSDFVLIVVPASLLVLPLLDLFGLFQAAIVKEQVGYDIARYAALADVSYSEANLYRASKDLQGVLTKEVIDTDCFYLLRSDISKEITLWPEPVTFLIEGRAECER